jgi:hypothetical protein
MNPRRDGRFRFVMHVSSHVKKRHALGNYSKPHFLGYVAQKVHLALAYCITIHIRYARFHRYCLLYLCKIVRVYRQHRRASGVGNSHPVLVKPVFSRTAMRCSAVASSSGTRMRPLQRCVARSMDGGFVFCKTFARWAYLYTRM